MRITLSYARRPVLTPKSVRAVPSAPL
jgi:hypothetical protein